MDASVVGNNSWINNSIIGWECNIGKWVRMEGCSVLGEDVLVKDELYINGGKILHHKQITSSLPEPAIIVQFPLFLLLSAE